MKKSIFTILAVLSVILAACTKEQNQTPVLKAETASVVFTYEGGEGTADFTTSSDLVSAESDQTWCRTTVRKTSIVVRTDETTEIEARKATVTVKNQQGLSTTFEVTQRGVRYQFDGSDQTAPAAGERLILPYYGEDRIVLVIPDEAKDWLSSEVYDAAIVLETKPNKEIKARAAKIGYAISSKSGYFNMTQAAADPFVEFSPALEVVDITSAPTTVEYEYKTNATLQVSTTDEWLNVSVANGILTVRADLNNSLTPRSGKFTYSLKEAPASAKTIAVNQAAAEKVITHLDIVDAEGSPVTEINAPADGSTVSVTIKSNVAWKATASESFVTVTPSAVSNPDYKELTTKVTVKVDANSGAAREAVITLDGEGLESPVTVAVAQDKLLSVSLKVENVEMDGALIVATPSANDFTYLIQCETAAYVGKFSSDAELVAADVEYFTELGQQYGMSLAEVLSILCSEGPDESDLAGKLDMGTDYVAYAYGIEYNGTITTKVTKAPFKTKSLDFYGNAVWHDTFVSTIFNMEGSNIDLPCDVYVMSGDKSVFYVDSPYWYNNIASWFDMTPDQMKQYNGNYKAVMLEVDCSDPNKVVLPVQALGVSMSSTYGWVSGGFYYSGAPSYNNYGTYADNKVVVKGGASKYVFWSMEKYSNGALKVSALSDDFTLTITPGGSPIKPASVSVASVKAHKMENSKLPSKKTKAAQFHIMSVPFSVK